MIMPIYIYIELLEQKSCDQMPSHKFIYFCDKHYVKLVMGNRVVFWRGENTTPSRNAYNFLATKIFLVAFDAIFHHLVPISTGHCSGHPLPVIIHIIKLT